MAPESNIYRKENKDMNSLANGFSRHALRLTLLIASMLMLLTTVGCNSAPSMTPEKFVLNFIQKHVPMMDLSVADFYVKEERPGIIERIKKLRASNRKKDTSESVSAATYDFSKIKVEVIDRKEEYINDEPVDFLKVAATGSYTKTANGKSESLVEDEVIILRSTAGQWKVTDKINPWQK
ncbi:MAG: hypothetical protein AMK71_01070 [Nitrospira bacterium SG8_35_4]|nr:MAG: hypothetical protein AMK71_01070 [Nitrospira bacterium SG8_35_4]